MHTSNEGIELIKHFEGFVSKPYYCSGNVLTIGYGHTKTAKHYRDNNLTIKEEEAVELLKNDLKEAEEAVERLVQVPLIQNEFDALVSFVFNLGQGAFEKSTLLRHINNKDFSRAAKEFDRWVFAGGFKMNGLVRRRKAEKDLFTRNLK